ncbi:glycosyltransferase family 4 protein [Mesobacterium pallidum]|uniref:glycosyltransferase family 4 protein n=1 Tax=Mesobacterium pallidum TaxID=2872037 RepID=UPI001EE21C9C|nr:glycosyltransferase family 4 protein [Mesobacterium pallidum]
MTGRIAYLTGEYPRATDTFIQREVAALRRLGWEVETCSIRRTGAEHLVGPEQREEAARTFHVIEAAKSPARTLRALVRALRRPGRFWAALKLAVRTSPGGVKPLFYQLFYLIEAVVLADHLERRGVTHLHNHIAKASCTVAMLCHAVGGPRYSFTLHGPDIFFEPIRWRLDEKIAQASFVACISDFARSQGMCFAAPAHWDRMHVIHCGIEPERFARRDHDGLHLLFVGRLAGVKGLPVLFDALRGLDLPGLRVTLVGDGPERAALESAATGLPVSFVGYKAQSEVAELLATSDALVLPSFAEGVPVVLMEAMASGLPVVTTRIAGVPELVEDGISGRLVPPGDADALRDALRDVLSDPARARDMGAAGQARVRAEFTSDGEAARLSQLLEAAAGGPRPPKRPDLS